MEIVNTERFNELMNQDVPVLVDFFATWCGPCKMMAPVLESVQEELGEKIKIVKVDIDEEMDLTSQYGVMAVPTMILFKKGEKVDVIQGYMPEMPLMKRLQNNI